MATVEIKTADETPLNDLAVSLLSNHSKIIDEFDRFELSGPGGSLFGMGTETPVLVIRFSSLKFQELKDVDPAIIAECNAFAERVGIELEIDIVSPASESSDAKSE